MIFRFLGTGTSVGVPQIGCDCPVCTSTDPRDKRRRCGAYVVSGDTAFLIDTPPEMRLACVEYGVKKVDAVLLTHAHMDHVAGFDDIRRFNTINGTKVPCPSDDPRYRGLPFRIEGRPLDCYGLPETLAAMHQIFPYISGRGGENGLFRPQIVFRENTTPFALGDLTVEALRVGHGFPCCGYLLREASGGSLGYISDCHDLSDEVLAKLKGVDVMILNCLRVREHPTHLSLARTQDYLAKISPKKAYLIHMCHDFSHIQWEEMLPEHIRPAYDGLEIRI